MKASIADYQPFAWTSRSKVLSFEGQAPCLLCLLPLVDGWWHLFLVISCSLHHLRSCSPWQLLQHSDPRVLPRSPSPSTCLHSLYSQLYPFAYLSLWGGNEHKNPVISSRCGTTSLVSASKGQYAQYTEASIHFRWLGHSFVMASFNQQLGTA